jgi:chromosome partitioning protein
MRVIAIAGMKGGTGKTATAHNIAWLLARTRHVLLIDADPQGSLTNSVLKQAPARGLADILLGKATAAGVICQAGKLGIIPGSIALASVEAELLAEYGRENILKRALAGLDYDLAIIDCPPSLSLLTVNSLTAADGVLIPTQPQAVDLRGLVLFMGTVKKIRERLNPALDVIGILPTFYDPRLNHHMQAIETMRAAGLPVLDVYIRRSIRIAEAAGLSQSLGEYAPDNSQMENYQLLAQEIIKWSKSSKP